MKLLNYLILQKYLNKYYRFKILLSLNSIIKDYTIYNKFTF